MGGQPGTICTGVVLSESGNDAAGCEIDRCVSAWDTVSLKLRAFLCSGNEYETSVGVV